MVGLEFGWLVVKSGEVLFGELKFAHVGVAASLLFEAAEAVDEGEGGQVGGGGGKLVWWAVNRRSWVLVGLSR